MGQGREKTLLVQGGYNWIIYLWASFTVSKDTLQSHYKSKVLMHQNFYEDTKSYKFNYCYMTVTWSLYNCLKQVEQGREKTLLVKGGYNWIIYLWASFTVIKHILQSHYIPKVLMHQNFYEDSKSYKFNYCYMTVTWSLYNCLKQVEQGREKTLLVKGGYNWIIYLWASFTVIKHILQSHFKFKVLTRQNL